MQFGGKISSVPERRDNDKPANNFLLQKSCMSESRDNADLTRSQSGLDNFVPHGLSLLKSTWCS